MMKPANYAAPHSRTATTVCALLALLSVLLVAPAHGLKSDRNQPAVINADDVELDFKTGERTYTGNVSVQQGSMQLICDKLVATFANNKLAKATAYGSKDKLAVFKQRPDGKPYDVIGRAETMVLDEINQMVTLTKTASLQQGADSIAGDVITYDMANDKMKVKGRSETQVKRQSQAPATTPVVTPESTPAPATRSETATAPASGKTAADVEKMREALPAAPTKPKTAAQVAATAPSREVVEAPKAAAEPTPEKQTETAALRTEPTTGANVTTTASGRVRIVLPPRSKRTSN